MLKVIFTNKTKKQLPNNDNRNSNKNKKGQQKISTINQTTIMTTTTKNDNHNYNRKKNMIVTITTIIMKHKNYITINWRTLTSSHNNKFKQTKHDDDQKNGENMSGKCWPKGNTNAAGRHWNKKPSCHVLINVGNMVVTFWIDMLYQNYFQHSEW